MRKLYYRSMRRMPMQPMQPIQPMQSDDRFIGGGFLGPFILGGITGGLLAPSFYPNRPYPMYPPYQPYPPYQMYPY